MFYLVCGLAAAAVHVASDPASYAATIGASGAISGVLGGYLVSYPTGRVRLLYDARHGEVDPGERREVRIAAAQRGPGIGLLEVGIDRLDRRKSVRLVLEAADGDAHGGAWISGCSMTTTARRLSLTGSAQGSTTFPVNLPFAAIARLRLTGHLPLSP